MNTPNNQSCYELFNYITESIAVYETTNGEDFIFKDLNKQAEITENIKKEEIIGKNVIDVFPGIIDFGLLDIFKRVYKTGISENLPLKVYEDGRISGWRENYVHRLSDNTIIAIYDDLTKVKQLESSLKETKGQFRDFFENNKAVILKIDSKTRKIINCNKAASSFYGYTISELKSKTIDQLAVLSIENIQNKINNAIKNKSNHFIVKHKLANKEIKDVEIYVSPIKVKNELQLFAIIHDVTARIKSQKEYIENQRLSAIGEMASSIAHDFNNSLQTISGGIEMCAFDMNNVNPNILNKLKIIQENIESTAKRVNSLLKFSGYTDFQYEFESEPKTEIINLNNIIDNVIFQIKPLWKTKADKNGITIDIIKNYEEDFYIKGNKELIISAIFNVFKNSIEAMINGGLLTLTINKIEEKLHFIIKDTGIGMDEKTKIRLFQPFFSTKGLELGRGLGMSGVYSIINEHNGNIFIKESEVNKGTSIEIILPSIDYHEDKPKKKMYTEGKKLNILWVDDEEMIAKLGKKYMTILGHKGNIATSGKDAIKLLESENYDTLVTDIGMPEMNGWQLINYIRNTMKNDKINIILVSGWNINNEDLIKKYKISNILQKPITLKHLKGILN